MTSVPSPGEASDGGATPPPSGLGTAIRTVVTLAVCGGLVWGGFQAVAAIEATEPEAVREGATKRTAMLVETTRAEAGTFRPSLTGVGVVRPAREVTLRARVTGDVLEMADAFVPGGLLSEGDVLVRLDREDLEAQKRAQVAARRQAQAALELERGAQAVAKREFALVGKGLGAGVDVDERLVTRAPQVEAAKAAVAAARAAESATDLQLARTAITAPFDAVVLTREVDLGAQLSAGTQVARLAGTAQYWVEVAIPLADVGRIAFPSAGDSDGERAGQGSRATLRNRTAWPEGTVRKAYAFKRLPELDMASRMARVLVAVDDPLARTDAARAAGAPVLTLGEFVEVRFDTQPLTDVVRLPQELLRKGDTVWVMAADGTLDVRRVQIALRDADYIYVREGLTAEDAVVTTNLTTVKPGSPLRTAKGDS